MFLWNGNDFIDLVWLALSLAFFGIEMITPLWSADLYHRYGWFILKVIS